MRYIFILIAIVLITHNAYSQKVDFFKEDLRFRLTEEYFEVDGDYYFRNNNSLPIVSRLIYPFPNDSLFGTISSIRCIDLSDSSVAIEKYFDSKITFSINIPAYKTKVYNIGYHQKTTGNIARYILTTTHQWGKPFEEATYKLTTTKIIIDSLSYLPDKVEVFQDSSVFYWDNKIFMPDKDFEVFFHN